ncbi:ATP-binding protein [Tautonia sociabilis]|uniref:histidine kinase n=1 Tax=Tautonia sociabilis TaxID=2080755 RepID=A0A432MNR8_9BACT|nr:ATP-binding protein [Tautonia sociabilis]RUL89052.1 response regulator [Tautonia sociabilis]
MAASTEAIRDRNHVEVGLLLVRDADAIIESWSDRATAQGHGRPGAHRAELRDHLPAFLRALGEELSAPDPVQPDDPRRRASEHGRFRWQAGWELGEVVADYQLLRVVVLEHLRDAFGRDPSLEEIVALGVHFDDAVSAAVSAFVADQAEQLGLAHRRLNEFLGVLGHELRNPLGTIAVALQLARMTRPDDEDLADAIEVIGRGVDTMTRLMDDMLDVARITRGDLEIRPRRVLLSEAIASAVEATRPIVAERRHSLTVSPPPADLAIEADPTRLQQVIVNLVTNAAKYTPTGGRIDLSAGREGDSAVIQVRDNGAGIDPEFLPHLFDLFAQAPGNRAQGLGIGLALVRILVERHGGTITAQSDGPGAGSTFTVRLPLADSPALPVPDASSPAITCSPRRILVVDDQPDAARLLASLLEQRGHEVRVAFDGASALAEAASHPPDLVLLDLDLPDIDGAEVASLLRPRAGEDGAPPRAGLPRIVALTGFSPAQRPGSPPSSSSDPRFDLFLTKPLSDDALADALALLSPRPPS